MLTLPIKKKWFDMILSGEKKEEYRDIKPYYTSRFRNDIGQWRGSLLDCVKDIEKYKIIKVLFRNGYACDAPYFIANCLVCIGVGREDWGAEPNEEYYVLHIIEIEEVAV